MKRKQLLTSAFTVVLALTMSLVIYSKVKADDPPPDYWCEIDNGGYQLGYILGPQIYAQCTVCENKGGPYEFVTEDMTYLIQPRGFGTVNVWLNQCRVSGGSICTPQILNPNFPTPGEGDCQDIILSTYSTGTGTSTN